MKMKTLNYDEIMSSLTSIINGRMVRICYKTDLPVTAEIRNRGYRLMKIVETTVRVGVDYNHISSVIEKKANNEIGPNTKTNNYEWVINNKAKYNTNTKKNYVSIAPLKQGSNSRSFYIFVDKFNNQHIVENNQLNKNLVIKSYWKDSKPEIQTVSFDNIIKINGLGNNFDSLYKLFMKNE